MSDISLIDFSWIGDVAGKLIDALTKACGWVVNHDNPKRLALKSYIQDIQNSDYPPLEKAALISNAKKTIKEYNNQLSIVSIAAKSLNNNAVPNNVDEDWIALFMDKARFVSQEEFQLIWGKLLAEECNNPKSVPKGLLFTLEMMDREDAESFMNLSNLTIDVCDKEIPFVVGKLWLKYKKYGVSYASILQLQSLGLVQLAVEGKDTGFALQLDDASKNCMRISYFDYHKSLPESLPAITIGDAIYTKAGKALYRSLLPAKQEDFWEEIVVPWFHDEFALWMGDKKNPFESREEKDDMER